MNGLSKSKLHTHGLPYWVQKHLAASVLQGKLVCIWQSILPNCSHCAFISCIYGLSIKAKWEINICYHVTHAFYPSCLDKKKLWDVAWTTKCNCNSRKSSMLCCIKYPFFVVLATKILYLVSDHSTISVCKNATLKKSWSSTDYFKIYYLCIMYLTILDELWDCCIKGCSVLRSAKM